MFWPLLRLGYRYRELGQCRASFRGAVAREQSRVYRVVKWAVLIGLTWDVFGADALKYSWQLVWIPAWTEWTRVSIRRKLPVGEWPKQLYL
jgi:hypothetical protein